MKVCSNCSQELHPDARFCHRCGAPVPMDTANETSAVLPALKSSKKAILFGAAGIAVVAVIAILIALLVGGKSQQEDSLLYIKNKEIFYTDLSGDTQNWQLPSHLANTQEITSIGQVDSLGQSLGQLTYMSNDGKLLFFPDRLSEDSGSFNLYYRDMTDKDAKAVKIDSDVISYTVNESAKVVTYLKGEEGNLYQYILKTDSKDKLDGNVDKIVHLTADFKTIYYIKERSLYKQTQGENKVKIASDVHTAVQVYDSGELYFTKSSTKEIALADYVYDDMKDIDAALTAPAKPNFPSWWDFDTTEEYNKAYDEYKKAYDTYQDAYDAYMEKSTRDSIRAALKDEVIEHTTYSLYYFDGKEANIVTENFQNTGYTAAQEAAVIIYSTFSKINENKVKLSQLSGAYEVAEKVRAALSSGTQQYVATKDNSTELDSENAITCKINSEGTLIYFVDAISQDKNHGDLYCITIKDDTVGTPELYDSDVYLYTHFLSGDKFFYFKDFADTGGDLYLNKELIDYDVWNWSMDYNDAAKALVYFTDWNSETQSGTLKFWDGKKVTKVADEARNQLTLPDGKVLYLYDYSTEYYKGDLRIWNEGESETLDNDVVCIIPISAGRQKGIDHTYK